MENGAELKTLIFSKEYKYESESIQIGKKISTYHIKFWLLLFFGWIPRSKLFPLLYSGIIGKSNYKNSSMIVK